MTRIRQLFTFSNAIALIALFVALGGTVYAAGKISGSQIKPNSLPGNRIKPATITGKQIKPGSLTGKQVVGSSLTGVSASNIASVQYVSVTVPLKSGLNLANPGTASCPAGMKVIGGGATVSDEPEDFVNDSGPDAARTGWTANGFTGKDGTSMTVTAICTPVTASSG
jgi:hypothetical protein